MKGIRVTSARALLVVSLAFATTVASAQNTFTVVPAQQASGPPGLNRAARLPKAGMRLARVAAEYRSHVNQRNTKPFVPSDAFVAITNGSVLVEARATADSQQLLKQLRKLGLTGGARYGELVSGYIPVGAIEAAAALPGLRSITAAIAPIRRAGAFTSQGDTALHAAMARTSYSVDGSGVTVGVLSDSFDDLGGAAADVASGDLPVVDVLLEPTACGVLIFCIDEGRAMLQIVHDMAPGADLMFHTGLQSKVDYANGILALAAAGADVIVDDLLYLDEPMFQDGIVAQAVDSVVAGGAVYYSAAGNSGDESYEAAFDDSGTILCIEFFMPIGDCDPLFERVGRMHDFDPGPGVDVVQTVTVPINGVLTVALQWDQPFGGAGPTADHDVVLLNVDGDVYYTISANDNIPMGEGWEVLQFENNEFLYSDTQYGLAITYDDVDSIGPPATLLKMVVFGSSNSINEWDTDSSTIYGHTNAAGAEAVAAAWWQDTPDYGMDPAILEPYSSKGGTPILFNSDGSPKLVPENRLKPQITTVDGVDTSFFFSDPDGDGIDNFFGTSAAAPHAAGVAALLLEAQPGATPAQVNSALEISALDMGLPGFDDESGHGLVQADAAIAAIQAGGENIAPTAAFTYGTNDLVVDFMDTSDDPDGTVTAWLWDFGDGNGSTAQDPSHTYAAGGDYLVQLTVTDDGDLSGFASQIVTVNAPAGNQPPVATFSYSCNALDCTFTSTASDSDGSVVSWSWDFGDGTGSGTENPSHSYAAGGSYTVQLTVTDDGGLADATSQLVTANAAPLADFSYSCTGLDCTFTSAASDSDGTIVAWAWDFGDGNVSGEENPSHSFAAGGSYTVELTVTDDGGLTDAASQLATVNAPPLADFSYSCDALDCTFTSAASDSDGTIVTWAWDFGDGNASAEENPSHSFAAGGSYTVELSVTDDGGLADTTSQVVIVNAQPTADFTVSCTGLDCTFTSTATDSDGTIVAWAWDFGDGNGSFAENPSHTYSAGGSYTVQLTVTDDGGLADLTSQVVTLNAPPAANFSYSCHELDCTFTAAATDSDGSVVSWSWDFGDGNASGDVNPTHSYLAGGDYNVQLTVTDDGGLPDATSQMVTVNAPPFANFSYGCSGLDCTFSSTATDSDGSIVAWAWDFGDGTVSGEENPSHSYAAGSDYTVQLTVTDDGGLADSTNQVVTVNAPPAANFAYSCIGLECTFTANASDSDGSVVAWSWDFGDGSGSNQENASHSYAVRGNYTVTLLVTDDDADSDSVSEIMRVKSRGSIYGSTGGDGGGDSGTTIVAEKGRKRCRDGIDNDGDGLIDSADPDCQ